jgi:hypothetical protein
MRHVPVTPELSVEIIAGAQTASGAYPASPAHDVYRYAWLRDGSWCAQAMDRAGRRASAAAWHRWVADVLLRQKDRVEVALHAVRGGAVDGRTMLPARFTLDGEDEPPGGEAWPNFQLDCYGHWLWALADHVDRGGELGAPVEAAARLVVRYLTGAADVPCFDCWEEHPGHRHTATLASIAAGLRDAGTLLRDHEAGAYADELRRLMLGPDHTAAGSLVRHAGDTRVDGSLLWAFVPYDVVHSTTTLRRRRSVACATSFTCREAACADTRETRSSAARSGSCSPHRWAASPSPRATASSPSHCSRGSRAAPARTDTCPSTSQTTSSRPTCSATGSGAGAGRRPRCCGHTPRT